MANPNDVLLVATAALVVSSASLTAFGLRGQRYAGWGWWVAAMWLTALGTLLGAMSSEATGAALASSLLLLWPVVTLVGIRRFHARHAWPSRERTDFAVLAVAVLCVLAALRMPGAQGLWLTGTATAAVHLYAAAVLFTGPSGRDATPVQGLALMMALVGFAPAVAALPAAPMLPLLANAVAAVLGAIVLAFVAVTLVCERTERQLRESRRRLRALANLDALTHVPNRRGFDELAGHALRLDEPGSAVLLMFDVDDFKRINDLLGHAAGDRALCLVASCVQEHLRVPDVAGRYGGDEFVLLLRQTGTLGAMAVATRIVAEVQRRAADQQLPPMSLSFGLVQVGALEDIAAALRRADQALYEAKRQGRSCAVAALGDEDQPVFSESQPLGLTTV
ncbi:MAG: GGDEF domain-containing protein [Rubrivivax sp.]|nr:GGDEF domain-containing protein [Rubrivivax sp.]